MAGGPSLRGLAVAGTVSLVLYGGLALAGDLRTSLGLYLAVHGALFAIYSAVILPLLRRTPRTQGRVDPLRGEPGGHPRAANAASAPPSMTMGAIVLFAIAFRAVLVLAPPSLSDDIHRYVWDGRVQTAGVNPYRLAPDAPELVRLRDAGWERINHREIKTIYPPALEMLFLAAAAAGLRETGFKLIFSLFDVASLVALAGILRAAGRTPLLAAIYAWNPLVVIEVAGSGHADPVGLSMLLISVLLIIREQRTLSISAYAASCLARLIPLAFLPIVLRRFKLHHLLFGVLVILIGVAPYAGVEPDLVSGLRAYAENWDYNSVVYPSLRTVLDLILPVETLKDLVTVFKDSIGDPAWCQGLYRYVWPAPLARALLLVAMLAGAAIISFRVPRIERELFLASGLLLALTPTLHPWYLLWVLPFAAAEASIPWILFSGLAPLSYLSHRTADGRVPLWVLAIEWGALAAAVVGQKVRRSR